MSDNEDIPVSFYTATWSRWMVDSGATHHITSHHSDFATWTLVKDIVSLEGHVEIAQIGIKTVALHPYRSDKIVHLHNIMHVPDARVHYFSISALMEQSGQITLKNKKLLILV